MNKKSGFTLAEVLITLAIIGVVAALTIPTLVQSTNTQSYTAILKKTVSVLSSSLQLNGANGVALTSITASANDTGNNLLAKYFKTNLSTVSDDGAGTLILADGSKLKFINSAGISSVGCTDTTPADGICDTPNVAKPLAAGLPAGLTAAACPVIDTSTTPLPASGYCMVYVDVNGDKLPNKVSTAAITNDIFLLGIDSTGVKPINASVALNIPHATFATGDATDVSPANASILALTQ